MACALATRLRRRAAAAALCGILGLLLGDVVACTSLFGRSDAAKAAPTAAEAEAAGLAAPLEEAGSDHEAGVKKLSSLMRQFHGYLSTRNFPAAEKTLKRAERGLDKSSTITRSHPDFDDVAERVQNGRPALASAIERDRIERRNAAIDELIRRGNLTMVQAGTVLTEVAAHPPTDNDLEHLSELEGAFKDLKRLGDDYNDEARYRTHAAARDAAHERIAAARVRANRQLETQRAVTPVIDAGIAAANRAKSSAEAPDQLAALRQVVETFTTCANTLQQLATQPGFDAEMLLATRLGTQSASATEAACNNTARQATLRLNRFAWESSVREQVNRVQKAVEVADAARAAAERETTNLAAITELRTCEDNSRIVARQPGYDPQLAFDTPFGKLTTTAFVAACGKAAAKRQSAAPGLHWLTQAASFAPKLDDTKERIDAATAIDDPGRAAPAWSVAMGALQECLARANELLGSPAADRTRQFETPWGALTVPDIARTCEEGRVEAERSMARALAGAQAQAFLANCNGDEVDVARREGTPTRIEVVPQGRIFIYGKPGAERRFGFNAQGQRVDFSLEWKLGVRGLIDQIAPLLAVSRGSGQAAQDAAAALAPVLETCQAGSVTERHPGFDAATVFDSPFGKVHATELRKACAAEAGRLTARALVLSWQARAEALRERVDEAVVSAESAAGQADPEAQLRLLAAAQGGYTECTERAEALVKAQGADKKFKVPSRLGGLPVADLGKACQKAGTGLDKRLAAAQASVKLKNFRGTCRGDEAEVVDRSGMPTKVEPLGEGRVFVYGSKRYAFDAAGHRTDEKLLRPAAK